MLIFAVLVALWLLQRILGAAPGRSGRRQWHEGSAKKSSLRVEPEQSDETGSINWCHTKVAGVSHENRDGTQRQEIASRCQPGERLRLVAEPDNPVDPNAIKVVRANGEQLGYLKADLAARIQAGRFFDSKLEDIIVELTEITGGSRAKPERGVNIALGTRVPTHRIGLTVDLATGELRRTSESWSNYPKVKMIALAVVLAIAASLAVAPDARPAVTRPLLLA